MNQMINILDLSIDELKNVLPDPYRQTFRAKQISFWVYKGVSSFNDMSNLPAELRVWLSKNCVLTGIEISQRLESKIDSTVKYAMLLKDGNILETVLMRYNHGSSVCISTQIGCKMGCGFCASSGNGFVRNLSSGEIIGQVLMAGKDAGERISNVVLMGIGEPLDNIDNVIAAIKRINDADGLNIGMRHISLSTCGIIPGIERLAKERLQLTLSVSLHAPNDIIRKVLMPAAARYPYDELIEACRNYADITGRRITIEYAMIRDINDKEEHAVELAERLGKGLWHVNLIPLNEVPGKNYKKSSQNAIKNFKELLEKNGLNATVRRSLGDDISASCGQLRKGLLDNKKQEHN